MGCCLQENWVGVEADRSLRSLYAVARREPPGKANWREADGRRERREGEDRKSNAGACDKAENGDKRPAEFFLPDLPA